MAPDERRGVLHRLDIDLGDGQEGAHPYVHHEAALYLVHDDAERICSAIMTH